MATLPPSLDATSDPYAGLRAVPAASAPIHIPSGIPGEPATTGTATLGTPGEDTTPFPVQQDSATDQAAWIARFNEFDRIKRQAEEDRAFNEMLVQNRRIEGAAKAVEQARRFQAVRQYQGRYRALTGEGLSPAEASARAAFEHPDAFGSAIGGFLRATSPLGGDRPASVVTDPRTGKPVGLRIPTGPTGSAFRADPAAPRPGSLTQVEVKRIGQLDREETELKKQLPEHPPRATDMFGNPSPKRALYDAATNSIATIRAERDRLLGTAAKPAPSAPASVQPASKAVRVRRKSDSKVFTYPGAAAEVPLDRYEILP